MAERKLTAPANRPVPMKLFATWEVDRTPPNCIPRYFIINNYYHYFFLSALSSSTFSFNTLKLNYPYLSLSPPSFYFFFFGNHSFSFRGKILSVIKKKTYEKKSLDNSVSEKSQLLRGCLKLS